MPAVIRGGRSQARTDRRTPVAAAGRCAESVGLDDRDRAVDHAAHPRPAGRGNREMVAPALHGGKPRGMRKAARDR